MTGAGFSLGAMNLRGERLPSREDLAKALWDIRFPGQEYQASVRLQDVFQAAVVAHRNEVTNLLTELLAEEPSLEPLRDG